MTISCSELVQGLVAAHFLPWVEVPFHLIKVRGRSGRLKSRAQIFLPKIINEYIRFNQALVLIPATNPQCPVVVMLYR